MSSEDNTVYNGLVVWFKNAFGFIQWEKDGLPQTDLFVHWTDIDQNEGFKTLKKGSKVSFKLGINVRNQPKAVEVKSVE